MMSQTNMILLAVLFTTIGGILGALVASLFTGRDRGKQVREQREQRVDPNRVEMFRVIRNRQDGNLHLEINGEDYASAQQLPDATKPALQRLLGELAVWLGLQPARTAPPAGSPPAPLTSPVVKPAMSAGAPVTPIPSPEVTVKPLSIVEQIDELLRHRLADSPLSERGIHLAEDPREGVIVWVGLEKYAGIDAIPDDTVRDFIKQVVAEWEERQSRLNR